MRWRRRASRIEAAAPETAAWDHAPLEPVGPATAAIRQAEEAAAALLAVQQADRTDIDAARSRAAELLTAADRQARQRAAARREVVCAEFNVAVQREQATADAQVARIRRTARDSHDLAVEAGIMFVLTGRADPCSSR
jgi:hypothetical protein